MQIRSVQCIKFLYHIAYLTKLGCCLLLASQAPTNLLSQGNMLELGPHSTAIAEQPAGPTTRLLSQQSLCPHPCLLPLSICQTQARQRQGVRSRVHLHVSKYDNIKTLCARLLSMVLSCADFNRAADLAHQGPLCEPWRVPQMSSGWPPNFSATTLSVISVEGVPTQDASSAVTHLSQCSRDSNLPYTPAMCQP